MISIYLNFENNLLTKNKDDILICAQKRFQDIDPFFLETIFLTIKSVVLDEWVILKNKGYNPDSDEFNKNIIGFLSNLTEKKFVSDCENRIYQEYRDYLKCLLSGEEEDIASYLKSHNFSKEDIESWRKQALKVSEATVFFIESQQKGVGLYMQGHRPIKDIKSACRIQDWGKFYHSYDSSATSSQRVSFQPNKK